MDEIQKLSYGSNSNKSKEVMTSVPRPPEKKVDRVVQSEVKVKKKGFLSKMREALISDDSASVKSYIFNDVLIPSFKKAVSDIITNGIDIILYGEARHSSKSSGSRVSYTKYYDSSRDERYSSRRSDYSYNDIIVPSRAEAERVLDVLDETISAYGVASVADFYDTVGVTGQYIDNNFGWKSLAGAQVRPSRDGWQIYLPRPMPIN